MVHVAALIVAAAFCWSGETAATEETADQKQAAREQREFGRLAAAAAASYTLRPAEAPDQPLALRAEPILKWSNPEHGRIYGHVFIWTVQGRPEAIASIYKWYHPFTHSSHELQSLSLGGLKGLRGGSEAWRVDGPGMELRALPDVSPPASTASERLRQMRGAARKFRVDATSREGDRAQLRLLAAPLYRYEETKGELIDGALFAFVEATDPEVILLIEARRARDGTLAWQYGLARLNSVKLQAFYQDREVWSAPELPWRQVQDRSQPYFSLRIDE